MNFFKKLAFKMGKKYLLKQLSDKEFKKSMIRYVNSRVDIPELDERQERQLFDAVYTAITIYLLSK